MNIDLTGIEALARLMETHSLASVDYETPEGGHVHIERERQQQPRIFSAPLPPGHITPWPPPPPWGSPTVAPVDLTPRVTCAAEPSTTLSASAREQQSEGFVEPQPLDDKCACGHWAEIEHSAAGCLFGCPEKACMPQGRA